MRAQGDVISRRAFLTLGHLAVLGAGVPGCRAIIPGSARLPAVDRAGPNAASSLYRLPRTAVPELYEIHLEPDLDTFTFSGSETVEVTVREPTAEVVLNAAELRIEDVSIRDERGATLTGQPRLDQATERATLRFPRPLAPGRWWLSLRFAGVINDGLKGFYRLPVPLEAVGSQRPATAGRPRVLAVTQFEPTHARRAFPCWDEPAYKAVFRITLVVDEPLVALSNAAVAQTERIAGTGQKAVRFAPTIRIPTYVVAFVVGPLEATDPLRVGRTPLRVWSLPGKRHLARFAEEIAAFSLRYLESYYGLPYPGDKLDLIAIPEFAAGAMENMGAVIFRERNLLVDPTTATQAEQEAVANTVAHEIAHMWFGNLVTMRWWNGLWLKEAFATFMEMLTVDRWRPRWQRWATFSVARAAALELDGLLASRPVEFSVVAPRDAEAMFDLLTYQKGAAILRMLEQFLGPRVFRGGVQRYLADHRLDNVETVDLWRAMEKTSRQPIPSVTDAWVFRPGYPLIALRLGEEGRTLHITQHRFSYLRAPMIEKDRWDIPVNLRLRRKGRVEETRVLVSAGEQRVDLQEPVEWLVGNAGGHGFYRVRYDGVLLEKLLARPQDAMLAVERFNVLNDAWACALAGLCPVTEYLALTARFREETDPNVWTAIIGSFTYLDRVVEPAGRRGFEAMIRDRLEPALLGLGWGARPGESELTRRWRADVLRAIGTLGNHPGVQVTARALFAREREDPAGVDRTVVPALIAIVAHAGGSAEYEEFSARLRAARTPQDEQRYLFGLAGFRNPELVRETLARITRGEVRSADAPRLLQRLLMSVHSREQAWQRVKDHWDVVERRYGLSGLRAICKGLTGLTTPALEEDVRDFLARHRVDLGGKTLEQYLEHLRIAVVFRAREGRALEAYLSNLSSS